jgi:hypothetical protein
MSEQQPNFWLMLLATNAWPMHLMETTRSQGTCVPWPQKPAPELRSSRARQFPAGPQPNVWVGLAE